MEIKAKMSKWALIKLKGFYTEKETINKMKRQHSEWEKIIANKVTDKRLISKIMHPKSSSCNPISKKNKQPNPKKKKEQTRHFSKEDDIQMANKHMKRYSALLIIIEMQIKTRMSYHLTPVRMAIIKKSTNNKCWRGYGER